MKSVKSAAELKALALKHGASVRLDGQVFNASAQRLAMVQPPRQAAQQTKPEPAEKAAAPTVNVDMTAIASAMVTSSEINAQAIRQMGAALAQTPQAAPASVWNFKVTYDSQGRITNIKATCDD